MAIKIKKNLLYKTVFFFNKKGYIAYATTNNIGKLPITVTQSDKTKFKAKEIAQSAKSTVNISLGKL